MSDFNGYTNWASREFSLNWSNDQGMYDDFVEKAAGLWGQHKGNPMEIGRIIVDYAREYYTGSGEGATENTFRGIDTDAEWDEIDRTEVGEEILTAMECHGRYAYLLEGEEA